MGYNLKDFEFAKKLQMADDEQQYSNVKDYEKHPKQRFVSSNCGKQKGVGQCPQPPGLLLWKDL
jgi:hypothetical protein